MTKAAWIGMAAALILLIGLGTAIASPPTEVSAPSRPDKVVKTDDAWKAELDSDEFHILRQKGTERAFTGDFWDDYGDGIYTCGGCGLELFHSDTKFKSGTGWPSYFKPIAEDRIDEHVDRAFGMVRTEVTCARCGGHLGHVFPDGPKPTGLRYCINGTALDKKAVPPKP